MKATLFINLYAEFIVFQEVDNCNTFITRETLEAWKKKYEKKI